MELRRALYLIAGLTSVGCGDIIPEIPDVPGKGGADAAASPDANTSIDTDAGTNSDGGAAIIKRRSTSRVVTAPPSYVIAQERYRYEPKTNNKAQGLHLTKAPRGMLVSGGAVEWSPGADQGGKHRVVLQARDDDGESVEQEFDIEVATSTLMAEGEVSSEQGGVVVASNPRAGRMVGAGIQVPARAVKAAVSVSVSELDQAPSMPNAVGVIRPVRYGPSGLVFDAPARVSLPLPEGVVHAKSRINAYVYNPAGRWERARLVAVDAENGMLTAEAHHFSIYAAAQTSLDLELTLAHAEKTSACEGGLVARAFASSPLAEIELASVNNLSSQLRERIGGSAPSVADLLRSPDFKGSLRSVQLFELVEKQAGEELVREQRLVVTTLYVPGDGSADVTHTDALGNVLAAKHYAVPALELADIEQRLRGGATAVHFATAPSDGHGLAARVHLSYFEGDASLDPVSTEDLGLAAIDHAGVFGIAEAFALGDRDCDGLVDSFDTSDDRLLAMIEAKPSTVTTAFSGDAVTLFARVARGEPSSSAWSVLERAKEASLEEVAATPSARSFKASTPGRYLVSYRAEVQGRTLENVFAIDVLDKPAVNTAPSCAPAKFVDSGRVGEAVGLSAVVADRESPASALRVEWGLVDVGSGQAVLVPASTLTASGTRALFAPTSAGKYVLGCRAFDGQTSGAIGQVELSVVAHSENRAPELSLSPLSKSISLNEALSFSAWAKDPDGDPLTFSWTVEGATSGAPQSSGNESRLQVTGSVAGVAKVIVSVSDGKTPPVQAVARLLVSDQPFGTVDADRDGWPAGKGALADCDDSNPLAHPTAREVCGDRADLDCDGSVRLDDCDYDDFTVEQGDCDDANPNRYPRAPEFCDDLDNDCNQVVDDNFSVGATCVQGQGICQAYGKSECSADGLRTLCEARPTLPRPEVCDRQDNDCDGLIDEDAVCGGAEVDAGVAPVDAGSGGATSDGGRTTFDAGVEPYDAGVGVPADSGRIPFDAGAEPADAGGTADAAVRDAGVAADASCNPVPEVCDGLDNDCNGKPDDIQSTSCYTGLPGRCAYGTQRCDAAGTICDIPVSAESCNQVDDDCDGLVDEGLICTCDPKLPEDCKNGIDDNCNGHVDGKDPACQQACAPTLEICNDRVDNDCDGAIDAADLDCMSCQYQGAENCQDRIDNDCNGLVDAQDPACGTLSVGESCDNPHGINIGEWNSASLNGRKDDMNSSCFKGGADYVFRFDVKSPGTYAVLYQGSEPHAWAIMQGYCSAAGQDLGELACKDASNLYLEAGTYFLVVEGYPEASSFSVVVQPDVPIGRTVGTFGGSADAGYEAGAAK